MTLELTLCDWQIFSNKKVTLEDILARKGETVSRGTTDSDGRIEFWKEHDAAAEPTVDAEKARIA